MGTFCIFVIERREFSLGCRMLIGFVQSFVVAAQSDSRRGTRD